MASRKRSLSNDADFSLSYKEWDGALCPICMDHPHNAVLLICSSHDKGCRSYICDTSYRHSNCFDRFKKLREENTDNLPSNTLLPENHHIDASNDNPHPTVSINAAVYNSNQTQTGTTDSSMSISGDLISRTEFNFLEHNIDKSEVGLNLRCPLCRGNILGWKVIEEARRYLNLKSRSCSHESCSFSGNYRELRRHARRVHPTVRPADVDPTRQRSWRQLEDQRDYDDIVSAIHSAIPGALILGDYVIENGNRLPSNERDRTGSAGNEGGRLLSTFFLFQMIGSMDSRAELRGGRRPRASSSSRRRFLWGENLLGINGDDDDEEEEDEEEEGDGDEPEENDRNDYGPDLNLLSDLGDDNDVDDDDIPSNPRRRRRLTRARSDEDQQ